MIHIALVEDDVNYVKTLNEYLLRYEKEKQCKIKISVFYDAEDIVNNYLGNYDIILMDIELKFMDGISAAEKIREMDSEVVIIFITNMPQYAMQGYKVDALDYTLKPISYYALSQRIERSLARINRRKRKSIVIVLKSGMKKIDISLVKYVEVMDHDVTFHTKEGLYTTKSSLKDIEKQIDSDSFFRCHKCYLVNLEYVDKIQNNDIYIGEDVVTVSRGKKKELLDALNNYINEVAK